MKSLNLKATKIFCGVLKKLNGSQYLKLNVNGFMPLTVEQVGENISTAWGLAKLYSLSHSYVQNGDLMRDPEMCFIVADRRTDETEYEKIDIFPQMYQQDNLGIYEESILIESSTMLKYNKACKRSHAIFANQWLSNIMEQGFLK